MIKYVMVMITVTTLLFLGYSGCGFVHDEHLDGPYYLNAVDVNDQMSLSFDLGNGDRIGRVSETVFAAGFNAEYVVAKRHPSGDKSISEYFYVIRKLDNKYADPSTCVRGPYTKTEYEAKKTELNLPEFTRVLSTLN